MALLALYPLEQKDDIVPVGRAPLVVTLSIVFLFSSIVCGETQIPTQEPVEFHPTAAEPSERAGNPAKGSVATSDVSAAGGDADAGEGLFSSAGCTACHSIDDNTIVGPGLVDIYTRAGDRTSLDSDAYIEQSIREPGAFVVDGFPSPTLMPSFDDFSDEEITNLIAYMKTLK